MFSYFCLSLTGDNKSKYWFLSGETVHSELALMAWVTTFSHCLRASASPRFGARRQAELAYSLSSLASFMLLLVAATD